MKQGRKIISHGVSYLKEGTFHAQSSIVYDVISQTHKYHLFIPWCTKAIITKNISPFQNLTQLQISFSKFKNLSYISHVKLTPSISNNLQSQVLSICQESPLRFLKSLWTIKQQTEKKSEVTYNLQFQFRSPIYQLASSIFVDHLGIQMWEIFQKQSLRRAGCLKKGVAFQTESEKQWTLEEYLDKYPEIRRIFAKNKKIESKIREAHDRLKKTKNYEEKMLFEIKNILLYN